MFPGRPSAPGKRSCWRSSFPGSRPVCGSLLSRLACGLCCSFLCCPIVLSFRNEECTGLQRTVCQGGPPQRYRNWRVLQSWLATLGVVRSTQCPRGGARRCAREQAEAPREVDRGRGSDLGAKNLAHDRKS